MRTTHTHITTKNGHRQKTPTTEMPTAGAKKKAKKAAEDPLSSSGVSSLSGISSYNIRKISVYKNGDRFHRGVKFVINPRIIKEMEPLLNQINDRIELSHGAKKLYTTDGKVISSIKELEDGKIYIAASAQFIPMRYGEITERVWKPPSRKHSPIMSADRIKTARTRSQDPGKRGQQQAAGQGSAVQRSRSVRTLHEDRKSKAAVNGAAGSVATSRAARAPPAPAKKQETPILSRPKAPVPKITPKKLTPTVTSKKPPTPKKRVGVAKKAIGAGEPAKKAKPATPKPIPTAFSDVSTASSVMPQPNIESNAAEILEFPEEAKKVDVATIHRTPTPSKGPSRSASAKSPKAPATPAPVSEAKSVSQQPTPESSEEEEDESVADDEEEGSEEVEEASEEEEEEEEEGEEEEEEEDAESGVETPASRRSSSAGSTESKHDAKK
ncbi:unnamed protein product [Caenorhabditis sp. 36 PRJEB53466]|nr:unnamed protein product [Caenorhabditis sp. 36 PRJEB53466]